MNIKPEYVRDKWEDNTPFMQAHLLAYEQTRQHDEAEEQVQNLKAMAGSSARRRI